MVSDDERGLVANSQLAVVSTLTPVGVLPVHEVTLVEAADRCPAFLWSDHACTGNPIHIDWARVRTRE